ncbi:hypothetical protein EV426DRAFT_596835 [Tirmania nivea]|nr:hypothetical protein EV426DRAFT_596835 [Tirmania nivea]
MRRASENRGYFIAIGFWLVGLQIVRGALCILFHLAHDARKSSDHEEKEIFYAFLYFRTFNLLPLLCCATHLAYPQIFCP